MLRVPRPPPLRRASCGYITRGGRGGWRSARAALSLSNSPGEAAGELSLPSLGENWVSTGLGARHEGLSLGGVGVRGRGAPPELCLSRVAQIPSPAESPAALIASRAGYRAAPRCFGGADVPGRAEPSPGGVQHGRGGSQGSGALLPARPPSSGRGLRSGVSRVSPFSAWPGSGLARGVCFPAVPSAAGAAEAPRQEASLVPGRLSAGCSSFLPWSRGLCGPRVMCWKAPESLER